MASKPRSETPPSKKRLLHELQAQGQEQPPFLVSVGPVSDDEILTWEAVMKGVPGTAYEAGLWKLLIRVPDSYPLAPPNIRFDTPICHPNINFKTGEICLDLLKTSWTPAYTIASTLGAVHQLLAYPAPDSPLNLEVAALLREGDVVGAEALVRFYCEEEKWRGR